MTMPRPQDTTSQLRCELDETRVRLSKAEPEDLTRIFAHGFTTNQDGHGFGLHNAALAAKEMSGELKVQSDGPGQGATFTLELPLKPINPNTSPGVEGQQLAA